MPNKPVPHEQFFVIPAQAGICGWRHAARISGRRTTVTAGITIALAEVNA